MSKRKTSLHPDPSNLPRRLREGLDEAGDLLEKDKAGEALEVLEELDERYPNQVYVLEMLVNAYYDLKDMRNYMLSIRRLHRLTPNRAEIKLGLAGAYMTNLFPALALITFREFLKRWPQHERAEDVRKTLRKVEEAMPHLLKDTGLNIETGLDFVCQHEEAQVCMNSGEFARAKSLIEKLQRQKPDFVPPLNNLSQIYWLEGDLPRAIETARRVLAIDADNLHATANLVRFLYLVGQKDEAAPLLERLKNFTAKGAQPWVKIAETLAFIGDDQGMLSLAMRAEKEAQPGELDELFYHYLAVSECIMGKEKEARKDWQRALEINPAFSPARENLDDLKQPPHKRNGPSAFPLAQMLPRKTVHEMARFLEQQSKKGNNLQATVRQFIDSHPELLAMVPLLLERGEAQAREYVFMMADLSGHPALLSLLKDYALGQKGSDESRMKAAQILSKFNVLPSGQVEMWIGGQRQSVLLLGFEITPEPMTDQYPLKEKVADLLFHAIEALHEQEGAQAEELLRKALAIQPEHPSLLNNLALALELQRKKEERNAIIEHLYKDFPDYFFGQMALARQSIDSGDLEKARAIIDHWMSTKKKYHVTEFNMLCMTQIDLFLEEENFEGALSWMEMWEATEPDDPQFETYQEHLAMLKAFKRLSKS
jgi:predicted Zn-dependent protease